MANALAPLIPNDSTDYDALSWCKHGSLSFAEQDWNKLMIRIRDHFKTKSPLLSGEGDWDERYVYYTGSVYGLEGTFFKRDRLWINHSATINFDEEKFMKDLTCIGRWEK